MNKVMKYSGITILLFLGLFFFAVFVPHIDRAAQFDNVIMVDNEVYFVLSKEKR